MTIAPRLLVPAMALVLAACATQGVKIREVGAVHRDTSDGTTNGRIAIGLGQLRMGNVGLALESFRRAAREDPSSAEALAAMADCYQRMGRPQLARRYLEQALALRPQEPGLYRALASVSDSEGKADEAATLRHEAALRAEGKTAAAQRVTVDLPAVRPVATAPGPSVTVDLAPARPTDVAVAEGPRLVRMSMGEVMLVSRSGSPFAAAPVALARNDTVHAPLRILNAARIEGIAARTRALLAAKGFKGIEIGNAPGRRMVTEIHFAPADRDRARGIASRLPYAVAMVERAGPLVLLLGRDAGTRA